MKKVKNLRVAAALQAILLSGATLSAFVSCVDDDMEVADNPAIVSEIVDLDNSSKVEEVTTVQTDYVGDFSDETEDEYIDSDEVIVTDVNENESSEEKVTMTVSTTSNSEDKGTVKNEEGSKKTSKSTSKSGDVAGKSGDITTKVTDKKHGVTTKTTAKETSPVTKKTTVKITTTKPVTTKTITTEAKTEPKTEPITEPPVVTDAPRSDYNINEICYDANAFNYFANNLSIEMRTASDGTFYSMIQRGDTWTTFLPEAGYLLALLNYGSINDDVISEYFSQLPSDSVRACGDFVYFLGALQEKCGNRIDYERYTCDNCKYVGQYANTVEDNYHNGNFNNFIDDQIYNHNIDPLYLDSLAVRCIIDGYTSASLFEDEFMYCCNDFNDYFFSKALGNSYRIQ